MPFGKRPFCLALRKREYFAVMFGAPFSKRTHAEAADAAESAYSLLVSLVEPITICWSCAE
jgi:hypothetical protein